MVISTKYIAVCVGLSLGDTLGPLVGDKVLHVRIDPVELNYHIQQ